MRTEITTKVTIDLDVEMGAKWFAGLDDEQQVQFFNAVAEESKSWPHHADFQWCSIGEHLANCECATDGARDMVRAIAEHMEHYLTTPKPAPAPPYYGPDAPAIDVHPAGG